MTALDTILTADEETRRRIFAQLPPEHRYVLLQQIRDYADNPWLKYADDPIGFVTKGLGESVWSKQVEILESVRDNKRTSVPACHAPGKTHIASRIIAWWVTCHPVGTARVVTTATIYRQVRNILWPHIRRVQAHHNLPGEVLTTEWKIGNELVADGFSAADHNETAVQGIHSEHLLVVVDEAGGISPIIGQALEALMTGGHTRLLVLGNPPTDNLGSWFERTCNSPLYNVIPISAFDTPNFTGEATGSWAKNLVDKEWVRDVISEFGEQSPFVQARVYARFPRTTTNAVIPIDWLEAANTHTPPITGGIRLGVDVAADGGDEFVIAQAQGLHARILHTSTNNTNAVEVAGLVLKAIHDAEAVHIREHISTPVRVKIDSIGVGWGVASLLEEWGKEGQHHSTIVPVNVAQRADEADKFANQRAEMWWTTRNLLQPDDNGEQQLQLDVDTRTLAQLAAPTYKSNSSGRIQIESKGDMKKRGIHSPDRAEAILLALFDPPTTETVIVAPLSFTQSNRWNGA